MLTPKQIGKIIKKKRTEAGLDIADIEARIPNTVTSTLSRIENGKFSFKETRRLLRICALLKIDIKTILEI